MENEQSKELKREIPDVLTVNQAAKEAGVTPSAVRNAIYAGRLIKTEMLEKTVIERAEFERWRAAASKSLHAGRPKGAKNKKKQTGEATEPGETQH